tara:strand:- start:6501 stop:6896 length:396 start_codon:yes stop_codon:yes gene_type:complete
MSITSLDTISKFLRSIINPPTPLPPISKIQIGLGMPTRPGLSAEGIWARLVSNKTKAGVPAVPSEQDLAMEKERINAIVEALLTDAKVEIVIPENAINVTVYTPGTPPTPIGFGINDIPIIGQVKGSGIIR